MSEEDHVKKSNSLYYKQVAFSAKNCILTGTDLVGSKYWGNNIEDFSISFNFRF
jgi:hypothetical protein